MPVLVGSSFFPLEHNNQQLNVPVIAGSASWVACLLALICHSCNAEINRGEDDEREMKEMKEMREMRDEILMNIQRYNRMFVPRRVRSRYHNDLPLLQTVASSSLCVQLAAFIAGLVYSCSLIEDKDSFDPEYALSLILSKLMPFACFACFGDPLFMPECTTVKGKQKPTIMDAYNQVLYTNSPSELCTLILANLIKARDF
eukprot:gnl/Chilomastix_caulleri/2406.p1 GENE.gnl/Chilomastix_caulleri/2406~~gnl/Chilomastix_caulleri/2406.p1  ORF type:complete len:201 (+),score=37.95 gnl/Chilomastix_caulleri/2406:211-813(+)